MQSDRALILPLISLEVGCERVLNQRQCYLSHFRDELKFVSVDNYF
jgi:hypothetical protein